MKINYIDRSMIRHIDMRLRDMLKALEVETGMVITIDSGSYTGSSYSPKLSMKVTDSTGAVKTDPFFQMKLDQHGLDQTITSYDGFRVTGYKTSRPKFPWDIVDRSGTQRKATQGWVMARFKKVGVTTPGIPVTVHHPSLAGFAGAGAARAYEPQF